jgi:hypothetical protein
LGQREAIAFGDGVPLPVRIKFDELPQDALPRSSTARFSESWQKSEGDEGFLEQIVERWRSAGAGAGADVAQQMQMFVEAMVPQGDGELPAERSEPSPAGPPAELSGSGQASQRTPAPAAAGSRLASSLLKTPPPAGPGTANAESASRLLRERLLQRSGSR